MTTNTTRSSAKALLDAGAVTFSPEKPYTFTSGLLSPVYVDNRVLVYHPEAWRTIVEGFQSQIAARKLRYDVIAGVAVGGLPHSSALAYSMNRPSVFIRKETKGHGRGKRVEGGAVAGRRVLLVEDLVTTGGSSLSAVDALRESGATVTDALAIISYGFGAARTAFERADIALRTLTDFETLLKLARERQMLNAEQVSLIRRWFADPSCWSPHA